MYNSMCDIFQVLILPKVACRRTDILTIHALRDKQQPTTVCVGQILTMANQGQSGTFPGQLEGTDSNPFMIPI